MNIGLKIIFTRDESKSIQKKGIWEDSLENIIRERVKDVLRREKVKYESFFYNVTHNIGFLKNDYYSIIEITNIKGFTLDVEERSFDEGLKTLLGKIIKSINLNGVKEFTVNIE